MARKRYSVERIVAAVKANESGTSIGDICRKMGIAEATFYRWKKDYGGLEPDQVRELKQLREGIGVNHKRVCRLYCLERLHALWRLGTCSPSSRHRRSTFL